MIGSAPLCWSSILDELGPPSSTWTVSSRERLQSTPALGNGCLMSSLPGKRRKQVLHSCPSTSRLTINAMSMANRGWRVCLSFLAARDINLPMGDFGESAEQETVWKPSAASVYFQRRSQFLRDATSGVQAARAGGFGLVVGVGQAGHAADLLKSGADYVVADLSDVRLERRITSA